MGDVVEEAKGSRGPIRVKVFGRTDVGLVREHNEDNFLVADLERGNRSLLPEVREHEVGPGGSMIAVCDGMGGAAAGEVASQIAVDTVYELMQDHEPPSSEEDLALRLEKAILDAGKRIFQSAKADRTRRGMGTTITAGTLISQRIIFGQVGDSRAYLIRQGKITQVTRDQSLVNQLIEAGQLKPEEAELFEHSNIILQALGTAEDVTVDLTYVDLRRGDRVLLCSDGLSGLVSDEKIRQLVNENPEPIQACKALTEAAREGGGHDNITVIVAEFEGEGLEAPADDEVVEFRRLELPGRTPLPTRQPPGSQPDWSQPTADEEPRPSSPSTPPLAGAPEVKPAKSTSKRSGKRKSEGGNPLFIGLAVVAVLAVGVGLGFLIVSELGNEEDAGSDADGAVVAPPHVPTPVTVRFTADAPGTLLLIDGADHGLIGTNGLTVDLPPGTHQIEARRGGQIIAQQRLVLREGQAQVEVPTFVVASAPAATDAGPAVNAGSEVIEDGGPKPPDTGPREMPEEPPETEPTTPDAGELPRLPPGSVTEPTEPQRPRPPRPPRPPQPQRPDRTPGVDQIGNDNPYGT